jgi:hypothetical protein
VTWSLRCGSSVGIMSSRTIGLSFASPDQDDRIEASQISRCGSQSSRMFFAMPLGADKGPVRSCLAHGILSRNLNTAKTTRTSIPMTGITNLSTSIISIAPRLFTYPIPSSVSRFSYQEWQQSAWKRTRIELGRSQYCWITR